MSKKTKEQKRLKNSNNFAYLDNIKPQTKIGRIKDDIEFYFNKYFGDNLSFIGVPIFLWFYFNPTSLLEWVVYIFVSICIATILKIFPK